MAAPEKLPDRANIRAVFEQNPEDLNVMRELIERREVTPVVDRTYRLEETREAVR